MSRRWLFALPACAAIACGAYDDRTLHRTGAPIANAGAGAGGASAGSSSSGAPSHEDAGAAGSAEPSEGGTAGESPSSAGAGGTTSGSAGTVSAAGSAQAGSNALGGTTSGGTASGGGSNGGGGTTSTAGTSNAGSAGSISVAGAPGNFPCGDIDGNGVDDCTETKILNSRFDLDAAHWQAAASSTQTWDTRDALGKASSGSLLVSNTLPTATGSGLAMTGSEQCVAITAEVKYRVAARVFVPQGQGGGEAGLNLWFFANPGCTGTFLDATTPGTTAVSAQWSVINDQVSMPPGSQSVLVRLVAAKPVAQSKLDALFDDVLLERIP